jgi:hypothetical protein
MTDDVYCIDASSLMELARVYPQTRFPRVWEKVDGLVESGRLIAPKEVLEEIKQGEDLLLPWARKSRGMFKPFDTEQAKMVSKILKDCSSLIDPMKETAQADPFLIALAMVGSESQAKSLFKVTYVVVTQEGRNKPNKIPQVCARSGVKSIRLLDMFEREKWEF